MEYNQLERFELWLGKNWLRTVILLVVLYAGIFGVPVLNNAAADNSVIAYPPSINTDLQKYHAVLSLLEQMRVEHNRQAAIAKTDWKYYQDKFHTYAEASKEKTKKLLHEKARLMETIRLAEYPTAAAWEKATGGKSIQELDAIWQSLYGDIETAKETPTLATSPLLDELKAIDLDKLNATPLTDPTEDYTTYTDVDDGGTDTTITADKIAYNMQEGAETYVYKEGKNFDGDFEHLYQTYMDSASGDYADVMAWVIANEIDDWGDLDTANEDALGVRNVIRDAGDSRMYLYELDGGTLYNDNVQTLDADTLYYLEVERDDDQGGSGEIYLYICEDNYWDDGGTQIDTLTVTLHAQNDFDTIYGLQGYGGSSTTATVGYQQYLDLQEVGGPSAPTVTTNNPNAVCETSANVSGNITATGGENPYWAGFFYDDDGTPYANSQGSSGNYSVGEFTENITGLSPGTKYHYVASANNTGGQGSGSEVTFITLPTGPTDISSPETGNSTANLTWSAVAGGGVDRYEIRRAAGGTPPSDNTSGDLVYNSNGTSTQDSGLTPGTQYTYSLFTIAEDDGLESCSANYTFITIWTHPGDVYGVSTSNVQQEQFQVDWTQGQNSENTTITWRDDASYPADPTDGTEAYNGVGTSANVTWLAAGTDYYVGMWGYDTDSGLWSINGYFFIQATAAGVTAPTVTTADATGVEETVATVGGEITNAGGENCTRLVYYDTDLAAPYSANWTDAGTWAEGVFSHELTGLAKGDKYAFMASANNTAGSGNGTVKYFMTLPDQPTSGNATGGTANISLAWTNGEGADAYIVYGDTGDYPAFGAGTLVYSGSDNTTVHSGLGNNETWYYRAWSSATEDGTTVYSANYTAMTATTDTLAPSMQTDSATSVTYNSATLNGQVLDTGGENPDVYFFWGTSDGGEDPASWSDNYSMGSQAGAFSHGITGLDPDTMYFFTVRGVNGAGTDWGSTVNFTTTSEPTTTPGGGRPVPSTTTTVTGSTELPQLLLILPVVACSIFAFWKENVILFYIAFGLSMITGLYGPDIAEGNTSTMGLMVGISFIAYAFVCFAFGMKLTFWRGE